MSVVAAHMRVGRFRAVGQVVLLLHDERVHVPPQSDAADPAPFRWLLGPLRVFDVHDDPGLGHCADVLLLHPDRSQVRAHALPSFKLLEARLWALVHSSPEGGERSQSTHSRAALEACGRLHNSMNTVL